ncbi:DUF6527 family protein [Paraburkholderia bannensis]|uniref:DUF6527 family protein n=2 Tax=Paraburkholderia bannensis TaxID=765414 RepID=UPI002ABD71EC|nr:DUF6527 family protein [Paraburkholderia bannensis]
MRWPIWILSLLEKLLPARKLEVVEGETLPEKLPRRNLVLLQDSGENWSVGMRCPCGCGQPIELALIPEARPKWRLQVEHSHAPTLSPSIWMKEGCRSHFFLRHGRVEWVRPSDARR